MGRASRRKLQRHQSSTPAFIQATPSAMRPASPLAAVPRRPLSEALIELIEPYRHEATTVGMYKVLVGLAVLGWNLASVPEAERETQIAEAVHELDTLDGVAVQEMIQALSLRKNSLFPHDERLIVGCEVAMTPNGYHVTVTSARTAQPTLNADGSHK